MKKLFITLLVACISSCGPRFKDYYYVTRVQAVEVTEKFIKRAKKGKYPNFKGSENCPACVQVLQGDGENLTAFKGDYIVVFRNGIGVMERDDFRTGYSKKCK